MPSRWVARLRAILLCGLYVTWYRAMAPHVLDLVRKPGSPCPNLSSSSGGTSGAQAGIILPLPPSSARKTGGTSVHAISCYRGPAETAQHITLPRRTVGVWLTLTATCRGGGKTRVAQSAGQRSAPREASTPPPPRPAQQPRAGAPPLPHLTRFSGTGAPGSVSIDATARLTPCTRSSQPPSCKPLLTPRSADSRGRACPWPAAAALPHAPPPPLASSAAGAQSRRGQPPGHSTKST